MTEKEMDKLAAKIVAKLITMDRFNGWFSSNTFYYTQDDVDALDGFEKDQIEKKSKGYKKPKNKDVEETELIGKLADLMTQLGMYQDREEYEECAKIKKEIKKVNRRLKNLGE